MFPFHQKDTDGYFKEMWHKINWVWRLIGTGIAFALFGLGGLAMTLFYFPLLSLIHGDPTRRAAAVQKSIHRCFRIYMWLIEFLGVLTVNVENKENLKGIEGAVVIANHPSLLDTVILMSQMDRAQCVVKHQLWNNFFLGGVMRAAGYIPNDEDPTKLIENCAAALARGDNLIIFPEGTRTPPGQLLGKLQRGAANVILSSRAPVLPVVVRCNHTTLSKGEPWYRIPPTKLEFDIHFTPLRNELQLSIGETDPHSLKTRKMTTVIKNLLEELIVSERAIH